MTFNGETAGWRIISIDSDGTIKIIKSNSIISEHWNTSGTNDWEIPASLNTYLNGTYYNTLHSIAQSQIVAKDFSIGGVLDNDTNLANTINQENSKKWNGKIALATASEYIRSNGNKSNCGSMNQVYGSNTCGNTTWMYNNSNWWTLTPYPGDNYFYVYFVGLLAFDHAGSVSYHSYAVRPTAYLKSEIKITEGDGSQNNPYTLSE